MEKWVVSFLVYLLSCFSVLGDSVYQGQGSNGIVRPNCQPTTLSQTDSATIWAVLVWKSQGFQTPKLSKDDIFCWDKYLSSVPDNRPVAYDLAVFKMNSDEVLYGIVVEAPDADGPVPVIYPSEENNDIVLVVTVPVENVIGYLRPRKLDSKTL